jgi:undecaprenyl-phosphate 4-deoxy-4-formamido-L-arabinose transferase
MDIRTPSSPAPQTTGRSRTTGPAGSVEELHLDAVDDGTGEPIIEPEAFGSDSTDGMLDVSVVVPVYRSATTLAPLCERIGQTLVGSGCRYEILLVEDCGGDNSWQVCRLLADAVPEVRALRLRRNFGQHNALLCGIREARGAVIVTLDDDLQNPPEEIPRLLEALDEGFDVVYGVPERQETTVSRRLSSIAAKRAIQQIGGFDAAPEVNSYRAFRADLARAFDDYRSPHVNIDVLLSWGTERYTSRTVRHEPRTVGQSGYSTFKLIRHALNMITGFSTSPLKVASFVGFGTGMLGVLMMLYVVATFVIRGQTVPGFAFLASSVALFSGVQLFTIGILGEYLGRLYFGTMGKPDYVVAERSADRPDARPAERPRERPLGRSTASFDDVVEHLATPSVDPVAGSAASAPAPPSDRSERRPITEGNRPSTAAWLTVGAVVAVAGIVVLATSRDLWFFADTWPLLAERSLDPWSWRQSHGGHLLVPATALLQGLFATVGMDFYPWYVIPRVVLAAAGALAWWRVARWRGVDPVVSVLLALLFSWLGVSAWVVTVSYVGPLLIMLCAFVAALMVEGWEPTSRPRLVLGSVLTLAVVTSSGSGPAVWLATAVLLTLTGRLGRYAWSIAVPGSLYLSWYLLIARNDPNPLTPEAPSLLDLVTAPIGMVPHIGAAVAALFNLSPAWSYPGAAALAAVAGYLWWRRRLGRFEVTFLLIGLIVAGLGVVVRQAQGIDVNAPNRMHLLVIYLLFPLAVAALRNRPRDLQLPVAIVLSGLIVVNLVALLDGIDLRERMRSNDRASVETAAALLAQGEPAIGWTSLSPQAHHRHLQELVDRGWTGELHPDLVPEILARMKTGFFVADQPFGTPPVAARPGAPVVGADGCAGLGSGEQRFSVMAQGAVIVEAPQGATLTVGWEEAGIRSVFDHEVSAPSHGVAYVGPRSADSDATLLLSGDWAPGTATVCGLAGQP